MMMQVNQVDKREWYFYILTEQQRLGAKAKVEAFDVNWHYNRNSWDCTVLAEYFNSDAKRQKL